MRLHFLWLFAALSCGALSALAAPPTASQGARAVSADEQTGALSALKIAVRQMGLGDADAALKGWAKNAPGREEFARFVADLNRGTDRVELGKGQLSGWSATADGHVRIKMRLDLTWWEKDALRLQSEQPWNVEFAPEGEKLKIWKLEWPLLALHSALEAAPTGAKMRGVVKRFPPLKSPVEVSMMRWMARFEPPGASVESSDEENRVEKANAIGAVERALQINQITLEVARGLPGASAPLQAGLCLRARAQLLQNHPAGRWHVADAPLKAAIADFGSVGAVPGASAEVKRVALVQEAVTRRAFSAWWGMMSFSEQAAKQAAQALSLSRRAADVPQQIESLLWQGEVARQRLDFGVASARWNEALALARRGKDAAQISRALQLLGDAALWRGDYGRAATFYGDAEKSAQKSELATLEAAALRGQTRLALATGRPEDAAALIEKALRLTKSKDLPDFVETMLLWADTIALRVAVLGGDAKSQEVVNRLAQIGQIYLVLMPTIARRGQTNEAMTVFNDTILNIGRAVILLNAATQNMPEARPAMQSISATALALLGGALELEAGLGHNLKQAQLTNTTAFCLLATNQPEKALPLFRAALKLASQASDTGAQVQSLQGEGDALRALKKWPEAAVSYREAIVLIEQVRTDARETSLQTGVLQTNSGSYFNLLECLRHLEAPPEDLLRAVEMAHARVLVDVLRGGRADVVKQMTPIEITQEKRLLESETRLQMNLSEAMVPKTQLVAAPNDAPNANPEKLRQELSRARAATEEWRRELFLRHPQLATRRAEFAPASRADIQTTLLAGHPKRAIAVYSVGEGDTLLFLVRAGTDGQAQITLNRLPVSREELTSQVRAMSRATSHPSSVSDDFSELRALLLGPIESEISKLDELIVIPDGPLSTLPFAALNDANGNFLISQCTVSYAPGLSALIEMEKLRRARTASPAMASTKAVPWLGLSRSEFPDMGLKSLPGADAEIAAIAPLFGPAALVRRDAQATKSSALRAMPHARLIHFATHGLLNQAAPLYSAVALAPDIAGADGRLYARDLLDLDLHSDLVVLSACETALGQEVRGEGVLGLTWALFVAGTPTSVVTQWSVDDTATSTLMPLFYAHLQNGQTPATAMRNAQLSLIKSKTMKHPAYWAPFIVVGAAN